MVAFTSQNRASVWFVYSGLLSKRGTLCESGTTRDVHMKDFVVTGDYTVLKKML